MRRPLAAIATAVTIAAVCLPPAAAGQTRAEAIAAAQATKAAQVTTQQPGKAERIATEVKRLLEPREGFYPWLDSVYGGGGFTLGAGYRRFYRERTSWDVRGLYSIKEYKRIEVSSDATGIGGGAIDLHAVAGWRDATQVSFYGIGNDTVPEAKSNFRMQQAYAGGTFRGRGPGPVLFAFGMAYEDFRIEPGIGSSPSIEQVHTPESAPGLGANPTFVHMNWSGGADTRPAAGYARRGGLYAVGYDSYFDPDHVHTFDRLQAEIVQHVPILREHWVLSLHGIAKTTLEDDAVVPYYLLPSLGSGSTLRAFPSWRFRDRHSLLLSGEWRWTPSRLLLDMAFFYDAGKVTARREDLNFDDLTQNAGVGVRVHGPKETPLRVDVALGSEGFNVIFSGGAAF